MSPPGRSPSLTPVPPEEPGRWVRQLLASLGVHVQEEESDLLRLLATPEQARLLGDPRQLTRLWALHPQWLAHVPQAQLVVPGTSQFEALRQLARERARLSRLYLVTPLPQVTPSTQSSLAPFDEGRPSGRVSPQPSAYSRAAEFYLAPVGVLFFEVHATGQLPWQAQLDVAVDLLTGQAYPDAWKHWSGLNWQERPTAHPPLPRLRRQVGYRQMLEQATAALRSWLADQLDWQGFFAQEQERQREEDQIHAFYDALARQERGLHHEAERAHQLEQVARRHSLRLDAEPLSLLILFRPLGLLPGMFQRLVGAAGRPTPGGRESSPLPSGAVRWDPLTQAL